ETERQPASPVLSAQAERDREAERALERDRADRENQGDPRRVPEPRIDEQEPELLEPGPARDREDRDPVLQRQPEHPQGGIHREAAQHHERRRDQQPAETAVGGLARHRSGRAHHGDAIARSRWSTWTVASRMARSGDLRPTSTAENS